MTHPMAQPWLDWQPIHTFPRDGQSYLAVDDRIEGGFPQVVYWDADCLNVNDATICYALHFFTHWAKIPTPNG